MGGGWQLPLGGLQPETAVAVLAELLQAAGGLQGGN